MTDIITKKRDGQKLTNEEIEFAVSGYTRGDIPDYQMSALLMATLFRGMDREETMCLTKAMMYSGDTIDLSGIDGVKADKHSTGGVGDKTSLVLCPMVAACGIKIAKLSGRGLGHTGGTLDKLESFKGFSVYLPEDKFIDNVNELGIAIAGQTANLVPADKKMYALRDVTGTVPCVPLIVSSIMSKKLASGADIIVLDVKQGSGSFMNTIDEAKHLAEELVYVGNAAGKKVAAVITNMDEPLGNAVGNALEVKEAIAVLKGEKRGELLELCLTLGALILTEAGFAANDDEAKALLQSKIDDGSALNKLKAFVGAQGGDISAIDDTSLLPTAEYQVEATSKVEGYVNHIDALGVGLVSMHLGGGRETKESDIDLSVGVVLKKKVGDKVEAGESLGTIHASSAEKAEEAIKLLRDCYELSPDPVAKPTLIKRIVR